jgi:glutamate synthase domain-containing protein 3
LIEVVGDAGPELACEMDAPGITVICRGRAEDGAARGLNAGTVIIEGDSGDALGYAQRGGTILVRGAAGHRAGLLQTGGTLILLGAAGRLAGERQSGGTLIARGGQLGPHAGRGRWGGQCLLLPLAVMSAEERVAIEAARVACAPWLPTGFLE